MITTTETDTLIEQPRHTLTYEEWQTLHSVIANAFNAAEELENTPGYAGECVRELGRKRKAQCEKAFALTWKIGYALEGQN